MTTGMHNESGVTSTQQVCKEKQPLCETKEILTQWVIKIWDKTLGVGKQAVTE